jgi:hypothetical protein
MYEVSVFYADGVSEEILCESKPSVEVCGGYIFLDCGRGQSLTMSIDTLFYVKVKYPLPEKMPAFKYAIDIHYHTNKDNVELLFTPSTVYVDMDGEEDGYVPVITVKEGDNLIRLINGEYLRSVKVNTYSEGSK